MVGMKLFLKLQYATQIVHQNFPVSFACYWIEYVFPSYTFQVDPDIDIIVMPTL